MQKLLMPVLLCLLLALGLSGQGDVLDQVRSFNNRGVSRLERFEYRAAAEEFRKAIGLKKDYVPALVNTGIALYYDSDYTAARSYLEQALAIDARQPNAHFMLGFIATKELKWEEALQEFQEVVAASPDDASGNYNLGLTYMRMGDRQKALTCFEKVLQVEPRHIAATYNLGMALMRLGRREEAQKVMARLQELKGEETIGSPMGSVSAQYGEEGRFAQAMPSEGAAPTARGVDVRFADVTKSAGLKLPAGSSTVQEALELPWRIPSAGFSREWAVRNLVPRLGSGVSFLDFNGDGKLDLFVAGCGGGNRLYRNAGGGKYSDVTGAAGLRIEGCTLAAAAGDYDNDGHADLFLSNFGVNALYHNRGDGRFEDVTPAAGVAGGAGDFSLSSAFFDYDHDGDLDLYVCNLVDLEAPVGTTSLLFPDDFEPQPDRLYRNNGNGTFTDVADRAGVNGPSRFSSSLLFTDFNESRDVDFFLIGYGVPLRLFSNNRDGTFADVAPRMNLTRTSASFGASVADVNGDGYADLVLPAARGLAGPLVYMNESGRAYRETRLATGTGDGTGMAWTSAIIDYDNDGLEDILTLGTGLRLWRNVGGGAFTDFTTGSGLDTVHLRSARSITVGDFDGDGDLDVAVGGAAPALLRNDGGNRNNYLKLDLAALNDNRSGYGTKVEVRSGSFWRKLEATGGAGYLSQGNPDLLVGLGSRKTVDSVRVLWPTGVLQAELEPAINAPTRVQQVDRKGTSCPILYAWDGSQYRFVTDFLGGSAVGYLLGPGLYNTPDTDEYVSVAGSQLRERNGVYSIKMNDQLEEVILIDQVRLIAVDHSSQVRVFPNERLLPGPPYPEFRIYTSRDPKPPAQAHDDHGNDVRPQLLEVDRRCPDAFRLLPFKGYAETHTLTLDLGSPDSIGRTLLLMTAWIDYADSTSNLAASQAGVALVPPFAEVADDKGRWVRLPGSIGFPAGLPKTMTVDLTGKFPNPHDRRVRITTNMRIYWDQILVDSSSGAYPFTKTTLEPASARLGWGGYPREYSPDGKKPRLYDYAVKEATAPWRSHVGDYTRYGDVTELLLSKDSLSVVMHHGDEITIDFDARSLVPIPPGWTRSFLVYAVGFGKDMDIHSAHSDTVGPLPYHGMPGYPFAGEFPDSPAYRDYMERYNTRRIESFFFGLEGGKLGH